MYVVRKCYLTLCLALGINGHTGVEWSEVECSGGNFKWSGVEWNKVERSRVEWSGFGVKWSGVDLEWSGVE